MITKIIRWAPIAWYVGQTAIACIFGSVDLPDTMIHGQLCVALVILGTVGQTSEGWAR
jgi:hypothetical protein